MSASVVGERNCGCCGRRLPWWRAGTWLHETLHCARCRRAATRTRPPMTRLEVWAWIRHEVIVFGVAALVIGAMAVPLRGAVHVSAGPSTQWPGYAPEFIGTVTAWSPGQSTIAGWVENRSIDNLDCPYLMAWVWSGDVQGHLTLNLARPGPLKAHEREAWTGTVFDPTGHPAPIWKAPSSDSVFVCLWS